MGIAIQPGRRALGSAFLLLRSLRSGCRPYLNGVWQLGKKVLATIFEVCPRVALLFGLKYGRLAGGLHGSPAPPHGYPPVTACMLGGK